MAKHYIDSKSESIDEACGKAVQVVIATMIANEIKHTTLEVEGPQGTIVIQITNGEEPQ